VSCPAWRWLHERGTCIVCVESWRQAYDGTEQAGAFPRKL
jgi:hypothetical protein